MTPPHGQFQHFQTDGQFQHFQTDRFPYGEVFGGAGRRSREMVRNAEGHDVDPEYQAYIRQGEATPSTTPVIDFYTGKTYPSVLALATGKDAPKKSGEPCDGPLRLTAIAYLYHLGVLVPSNWHLSRESSFAGLRRVIPVSNEFFRFCGLSRIFYAAPVSLKPGYTKQLDPQQVCFPWQNIIQLREERKIDGMRLKSGAALILDVQGTGYEL
eukprot:g991.t1